MHDEAAPLTVEELQIRAGERTLVHSLQLELRRGEFLAILGRNGSGKSLTLHALAGLSAPAAGQVRLQGQPLESLSRRQVALGIGLLLQDREEALALTTLESVLIGRHPHLRPWQREGAADLALAEQALARLGLEALRERLVTTLSGGEQRRAAMACLLAQQPLVYLLDEPTNHLDPHHQLEVLQVFRELAAQGACVVSTLHDPTLAERFADRALLLYGDGRYRLGAVADTLTSDSLSELYLTPIATVDVPPRRAFIAA